MSVISVYRTFYWTEGRLTGQTGHIWETKEEQARCIKEALGPLPLMSGITVKPITDIPPTEVEQQQDARYHIKNQFCLCGIHGYFSPNYLDLMTTTAGKAVSPFALAPKGTVVYTRVRLGGLVDIHSMGARGEYGLVEEAWCDDDGVAGAVAKRYDIPVNQFEFKKQPRTDPLIDKDAKVLTLSPLFSGMPEAVGVKSSVGPIINIPMQKMAGQIVRKAFGQRINFQQYVALMGGSPPSTSPVGPLAPAPSGPGLAPGGIVGPNTFGPSTLAAWTSQFARSVWNAQHSGASKHSPVPGVCPSPLGSGCPCGMPKQSATHSMLCPAVSGSSANCQCGAHRPGGRGAPSLWKCQVCGKHEVYSSDHVRCSGAPPKIVLKAIGIDTANSKPGIITRLKRRLGI